MKLYTEKQVRKMLLQDDIFDIDDILDSETPIELPSDEEINNEVDDFRGWVLIEKDFFKSGAKWMRNKILNK